MKRITILSFLLLSVISLNSHNPPKEELALKAFRLPEGWIFNKLEIHCIEYGVPVEYMYEVGLNESNWRFPNDSTFIMPPLFVKGENSYGDCQMLNRTYSVWSKKLGLKEKTRENLLIACIAMSKECYIIGDSSWEKARFIYARGKWRPKSTWTTLETKFMSKIDFKKYDKNGKP